MTSSTNYKDALFKIANLTPIHGKPTFETLHKLQNDIKANAKSVCYNLWGGVRVHLSLVLTNAQYALILNMPILYLNHPGPLVILDGTNAHSNSNIQIMNNKEVRLFREVKGFEQAPVQQIFSTVKEVYLADICNKMKNSINNTVSDVLTQLK